MDIHMIGTLRDDKDNIVGFRLFYPERELYKDFPYDAIEKDVKKSSTLIRELEYDYNTHSGIKGSCGSLDCYPKIYSNGAVANASAAIVITKGTDENNNTRFRVYNYLAKKVEITEADLIKAVEDGKATLANAKIMTNSNSGKKSIACKMGSFEAEMKDVKVKSMNTGESFNAKVSGNHTINDATTVRVDVDNKKSLAEELGITQLRMDNPFVNGKEVAHDVVLAKTMQKTNDYEEIEMTIEQKFTLALNIVNDVRPFYYSMLSTVGNTPTNDIDTMGVSLNKLYWSPDFVAVLSAEEVAFVLMHETLHLAMSHNARKGDRYAQLWNVACDYFVNTTLLQELNIKEPGQTAVVSRNMGGGKPRKITVQDGGLYLPFETDLSHLTPEIIYSELYEMARQENAKKAAGNGGQSNQGQQGSQGQQGGNQGNQGQQNQQSQGNQNNQATSSCMTQQQAANQIAQGIKEALEGAKEAQQNSGNSQEAQQAAQQITQGARNIMDSVNKTLNNKGNQQMNQQQGQAGAGMMSSGINKMNKAQQNGQQGQQSGQQSGQNGNQGNQGQQSQAGNQGSQGQNGQNSQSGQQGNQSGQQSGQGQSASNKMQNGMNKVRQGLQSLASSQGQGQGQGMGQGSGQSGQNGQQGQGNGQGQSQGNQGSQGQGQGQQGGSGQLDLSVLNGKSYRGTTIQGLSNDNSQDLVNDSKSENLSQERAQQIADSVLRRAVTNHKMSGKSFGGEAGSFLERYVEEVLAPKVNWKKVLKRKLTALAEKENSFSSPDKRFISRDRILPGPRDAEPGALEGVKICIDTSGSISDEDLGIALAQIKQLLKIYKAKAELLYWDTQVHCGYDFDNTSFKDIIKKKPLGGGGTDANCIFNYFNQCKEYKSGKKQAPSVVIVFTDGYFGEVERKHAKKYKDTIWVICSDSDRERFEPPFGVVAELKNGN